MSLLESTGVIQESYVEYDITVEYKEGDLVIKDGVLSQYWKYPNTGDLVWLNVNNYEQYDLFLNEGEELGD